MPDDPADSLFFGEGYWGRRVFWQNVPPRWRSLDTDGYLEALVKAWGDEYETFLRQIRDLPDQREPYKVRAEVGEGEYFYVTEVFTYIDPDLGRVTRLVGEKRLSEMPNTDEDDPPSSDSDVLARWYPWWPYAPISEAGRWWRTRFGDSEYEVIRARTRNYDPPAIYDADTSLANELWVRGGDLVVLFDYLSDTVPWTKIGEGDGGKKPQVTLPVLPIRLYSNDTSAVPPWLTANAKVKVRIDLSIAGVRILYDVPNVPYDGTGILYRDGPPGIINTGTPYGTVNYETGQIEVDLSAVPDLSVFGTDIEGKWLVRGYYFEFLPPRNIDHLARDFGFANDLNDPEDVQRSAIANIIWYFGLKASQDSYRIRGEISLFDVYVRGLWYICDSSGFPSDHVWTYGGEDYTDLEPRFVRLDDIAGDIEFYDPDDLAGSPFTILDDALMHEDGSADGLSRALAFSLDVVQGYYHPFRNPATIVSSTALTEPELLAYGLAGGWRAVVSMTQVQKDEFTWRLGRFGLTIYDKAGMVPPALGDEVFWIDAEEGWDPILTQWTIIIGTAATAPNPFAPGDDVAVRYYPEVSAGDCCFCKTHKVRIEIEATDEAYEHYETLEAVDDAIERLKTKLMRLVPIHVRVVEWELRRKFEHTIYGAQQGAVAEKVIDGSEFLDVATDPGSILLTIQYRGDLDVMPKGMVLDVDKWNGAAWVNVFTIGPIFTGDNDPDLWYDAVVDQDLTGLLSGTQPVRMRAACSPFSLYGDARWTFNVATLQQ